MVDGESEAGAETKMAAAVAGMAKAVAEQTVLSIVKCMRLLETAHWMRLYSH